MVEVDGRFVGQVTVNNIVAGSAQFALGRLLGRPGLRRPRASCRARSRWSSTTASSPLGLHRIEVAIRPENANSLRVVEKLGFREVGYAPRYLHIDGAWRDHRLFAVTAEECPGRAAGAGSAGPHGNSHQSHE